MKKFIIIFLSLIIVITGLTFGAAYFLYGRDHNVMLPYTTINGIDVSGLTADEAEDKLSENVKGRVFSFIYDNKTYTIPMDSMEFEIAAEPVLEARSFIDPVRSLFRIEKEYTIPVNTASSDEFLALITALPFCNNEGKVPTEDAYVDLTDTQFRIVKEKIGTEVDPVRIRDIALANIAKGEHTARLADSDIIVLPAVTEDSEEIKTRLQYCRDNLNFRLECVIDGDSYVITPEDLDKMADYSGDKPKVSKKQVEKFATDYAAGHNEYNKDYEFATTGGSTVTVRGVTYGKVIDKSGFIENLTKALKEHKDAVIEVDWAQTTYNKDGTIGNTYIEVSIDRQHVWCYKNGKLVVECDCVTGMPGHDTAKGVFIIQYVTGPTVLRGNNDDGSTYESPVNCFMPFYGGQGFHGSNGWRSRWGGNIYKTGGSHGCVNCPDDAAKKMADTVGYGYPVVIY